MWLFTIALVPVIIAISIASYKHFLKTKKQRIVSLEEITWKRLYYDDGTIKADTPYFKGKIHGNMNLYHENGELASSTPYRHGERHGVAYSFDEAGILKTGTLEKEGCRKEVHNYNDLVPTKRDVLVLDDFAHHDSDRDIRNAEGAYSYQTAMIFLSGATKVEFRFNDSGELIRRLIYVDDSIFSQTWFPKIGCKPEIKDVISRSDKAWS